MHIKNLEILERVIRRGCNTLLDLNNSSLDTQPHLLIVNYHIIIVIRVESHYYSHQWAKKIWPY